MFHNPKSDPMIGAVQEVMRKNAEERARVAKVNEAFGVQTKRQLPHERHAEYDRAIAEAKAGTAPATLKEEVQQIDELSKKTLKSYVKKATTSSERAWKNADKEEDKSMSTDGNKYPEKQKRHMDNASKHIDTYNKREAGLKTAKKKLSEAEQLDELSKNTLKSYVKKAIKSRDSQDKKAKEHSWRAQDAGTFKTLDKHITKRNQAEKKVANRTKGIETASKKLGE
jgi:hypothetical protein